MFAKVTIAMVLILAGLQPVTVEAGRRSLTGVVLDKAGNTLPGAVVQIENSASLNVRSYITDHNGRYYFNDLTDYSDYTVLAKYKKWRSETKTLSKFNSKTQVEMNLRIPID